MKQDHQESPQAGQLIIGKGDDMTGSLEQNVRAKPSKATGTLEKPFNT